MEAIAETTEYPMHTITLAEITSKEIIPEYTHLLKDFGNDVGQNQPETIHVVDKH